MEDWDFNKKASAIPQLLDGRRLALELKKSLKDRVRRLKSHGTHPGLAVILVGKDPASQIYVGMKCRQSEEIGIQSFRHILPESASATEIETLINTLNNDSRVHGILLQLPLPLHLREKTDDLINLISPKKDVDGLTVHNIGALVKGQALLKPCTPQGCLKLLKHVRPSLEGLHAVIIGRSHLVGRPLIQLLLQENCTVTTVHSKTSHIQEVTRQADILIAAAGQPQLVKADWVKKGAIVLDVGMHRISVNQKEHLVGDVDFEEVSKFASHITPVPGGVGPMTVACLLENTLLATEKYEALA